MIKQTKIPAVVLVILASGCDYSDGRLWIENKTDKTIVVVDYLDSIPNIKETNAAAYYLDAGIKPLESHRKTKIGSTNAWPFTILNSKNQKLNLIVYDIDSIRKYQSMDSLIEKRIYKRYEFSAEAMEKTDWKVVIE